MSLEREIRKLGDKDIARTIERAHEKFRKRHPSLRNVPFPPFEYKPLQVKFTEKRYPEISLEAEHQRQALNLAKLFAKKLNKTERQYIKELPKFIPQSEYFEGGFGKPVLVEGRVSPKKQCKALGIKYFLNMLNKIDLNKSRNGKQSVDVIWVNEGANNMGEKPEDIIRNLRDGEFGGNEHDGIALYIFNPGILENHYLDLPGTRVGPGNVAVLGLWEGQPRMGYRWADLAYPNFGSMTYRRQK